ncbi:MAG: 5-oxoprolinase subunit PxpA [Ostreibacterium sp.]
MVANYNDVSAVKQWKLNADVGEGYDDTVIMPYLDYANIACAGHAGDESIISETLKLAKNHHVTVGAHPGYADKAHFGRHSLDLTLPALAHSLEKQIQLLLSLAIEQGITPAYVKPHGALNHDMLNNIDIFKTICQVVAGIDKQFALLLPTNAEITQQTKMAVYYGLSVWQEVFADRSYEPNGRLRARSFDDAVHAEPQVIIAQLNGICQRGEIVSVDGSVLDVSAAQTICIHGDHAPSIVAVQTWATT